eukprot:5783949-Amphidinium_carterae.1
MSSEMSYLKRSGQDFLMRQQTLHQDQDQQTPPRQEEDHQLHHHRQEEETKGPHQRHHLLTPVDLERSRHRLSQEGSSETAPPGTGPQPKTNPPKKPPPGTPNYKPPPAPPPQKVIEPDNLPSDKGMSMSANVRWMENLTIYGAGEPWTNLEPIWHRDDIEEAYKAG